MFSALNTITIEPWRCPPKTWAWLDAECPGCGGPIRLIVGSRLHKEFSQRCGAELVEMRKAYMRRHGPITMECFITLFKAGKDPASASIWAHQPGQPGPG